MSHFRFLFIFASKRNRNRSASFSLRFAKLKTKFFAPFRLNFFTSFGFIFKNQFFRLPSKCFYFVLHQIIWLLQAYNCTHYNFLLLQYNLIFCSLCCYSTTSSSISYFASEQYYPLFLLLLQYNLILYFLFCYSKPHPLFLMLLQENLILYFLCCYSKTSSSIFYVATVQPHHLFLILLQPYSFVPYIATTLSSINEFNVLMLLQPHTLFRILLQPHSVFLTVATTSSSIPYVKTSSSITIPGCNLILYTPPLLLSVATN